VFQAITSKTTSKEVWGEIGKLSGKRKSDFIERIIKNDGDQITTESRISNDLAARFAKTSSTENYPSNLKKKERSSRKSRNHHQHGKQRPLLRATHRKRTGKCTTQANFEKNEFLKRTDTKERSKLLEMYQKI
jgi:hypothetical protein